MHQQRVDLERFTGVDRAAEELVVPRRRDAELTADRFLLAAGVRTPLRLEGEKSDDGDHDAMMRRVSDIAARTCGATVHYLRRPTETVAFLSELCSDYLR